jgi:hypothetical protein
VNFWEQSRFFLSLRTAGAFFLKIRNHHNRATFTLIPWCSEKVTFHPSDGLNSGPVSTILSARGSCIEESTFTVASLRTAGIPAREVYVPRWAHIDVNHAWVEVWINGIWHYMDACNPVMDWAWFTEPARRAMLISTMSFGAKYGQENTVVCHRSYSIVNTLPRYASTKTITVKVVDANNGLYIGTGNNLAEGTFFSGLIDDVRIYNKALSAEEITALAQ